MPITVCGINHKTAPLALREKLIFSLEMLPLYLSDLREQLTVEEAILLSTCNRSEIYCNSNDIQALLHWFCKQHQLALHDVKEYFYVYEEQHAVKHIMSVACGLDSMILGEPQILGQMKAAFTESCAASMVGPLFNRLFQQVFSLAKEVRTNTAIGACPVSVASAAVSLAKQAIKDLQDKTVLVIGAGDTANLVLRYLKSNYTKNILLVNRSDDTAIDLAKTYDAKAYCFTNLPLALHEADAVISATGSRIPIITKELMTKILEKRLRAERFTEICLIDIAVPRDMEASIAELERVSLYCIDDLKNIIQHNLQGREHAAEKARDVIQAKSDEFIEWLHSLDIVATTIKAYRKQIEKISQKELAKAAAQLQRGDDPLQVLASFSHAFTNKLLHTPSVQLRQAGVEGRIDMLQMAQELFAITE